MVLAGAGAAAGVYGYKKAEEERKAGASVAVHNVLASLPHADALLPEQMAAVAEQYGVSLSEDFPEVLKGLPPCSSGAIASTASALCRQHWSLGAIATCPG